MVCIWTVTDGLYLDCYGWSVKTRVPSGWEVLDTCKAEAALEGNIPYSFISAAGSGVGRESSVQGGKDGPVTLWVGEGCGIKDGGGEGEFCRSSPLGGETSHWTR